MPSDYPADPKHRPRRPRFDDAVEVCLGVEGGRAGPAGCRHRGLLYRRRRRARRRAAAPWFVLAAVLLGLACRTLDIEGWGLFIPGGLVGRAGLAFGPQGGSGRRCRTTAGAPPLRQPRLASSSDTTSRPCRCRSCSRRAGWQAYLADQDLAGLRAIGLLGFAWIRATARLRDRCRSCGRRGRGARSRSSWCWSSWAALSLRCRAGGRGALASPLDDQRIARQDALDRSSSSWFARRGDARRIRPCRWRPWPAATAWRGRRASSSLRASAGLRRTMSILTVYGAVVTVASAFSSGIAGRAEAQRAWLNAPLLGIVHNVAGPGWLRVVLTMAVVAVRRCCSARRPVPESPAPRRMLARLAQQGSVSTGADAASRDAWAPWPAPSIRLPASRRWPSSRAPAGSSGSRTPTRRRSPGPCC